MLDSQKTNIHATAIIDSKAELDSSVQVGPYTVIGPDVQVGAGTQIGPHVVLQGPLSLGTNNQIFQFASVGEACQDKKYKGEPTRLEIGNDNVIRECATLQRGTVQDQGVTRIGHGNLFMAYTHVGHDCIVEDHCVFANSATIAGHVHVGTGVILGGFTGVHQFCRIGTLAMTSMCSAVNMDIPAFVRVQGNMASAQGLNIEGMKRKGFDKTCLALIQKAYKIVYRQNLTLQEAKQALNELSSGLETQHPLFDFIASIEASQRGLIR